MKNNYATNKNHNKENNKENIKDFTNKGRNNIPSSAFEETDSQASLAMRSKPAKAKKKINDTEQSVLANLVENIQTNSALINGHIRRMFSL